MNKNKKNRSLERKKARAGWLFILPWLAGFAFLFVKPVVSSILYSFQTIFPNPDGYTVVWNGVENYKYALRVDPYFRQELAASLKDVAFRVPIIIIFGLFAALLLNRKFRGRTLVRAIFFLPVIIASGVVINILKEDVLAQSVSSGATTYMNSGTDISSILYNLGIQGMAVDYLAAAVSQIMDLVWKSGVQIILFLAGLQTVSPALYEAASIEGCTKWESFWKITLPIISPILLLNIIYTIVDSFTDYENPVMRKILAAAQQLNYGYSAAYAWIYFGILGVLLLAVFRIVGKRTFYMAE